ncbi:hypothetical protein JAAARDRAFT_30747 [Jaapia argillacea MUCL 33604]|uniref:Major facilitator superfamily (MFS) profile domain-containing protein n=1 Tax=Jaapia argillacea MUCL 33604 TaxID=933084 RepID=A0A067Q5A4_9AGAM|nr:hypothetical protein JAAARDRAFT_30747 [Jaapia argillacea MUCL 33604]
MAPTTTYAPSAAPSTTSTTIVDRDVEKSASNDRPVTADTDVPTKDEQITTQTVPAPGPPGDFPDGGWEAWSVVAGAWLTSFCTFGYINAYGVYQNYYQLHQLSNYTPSDISWIGSLQLGFIFWGGIFVGRLFDMGHLRWLLLFGSIWTVFSLMMVSLATTYWQIILAQGVALGLGLGVLFIPAVSTISHWFKYRRAAANGVLASGSSCGGIIFPIMLNKLANNPNIGFGWAVRATGFVVMGCLIAANLLLKTRLPKRKHGKFVDFGVFKDTTFAIYTAGAFFVLLGLYLPFFYLQSYALLKGIDQNLAFYSLTILNAASLFGRVVPNYLADGFGTLNILIPACFAASALIFVFLAVHTAAGLIVFAIFFGFFSGTYVSIIPAGTASLTKDMSTIGIRNGMSFFMVGWAALFGTPIAGAIVSHQGGETFWGAVVFSGVSALFGVGLLVWARERQVKVKGTWRV